MANAEQFGILSIVTALAVRFLFYEEWTPAPEAAQNTEVWVQTAETGDRRDRIEEAEEEDGEFEQVPRDVAECLRVMNAAADTETGTKSLLDSEIISLVEKKHIPGHQLEKALGDPSRGVRVRRKIYMKHGNLLRERGGLHAGAGGGGGAPQHGQRQPVRADGHDGGLPGGQH